MELTKVDLRGVEPGGPGWEAGRGAVTASMVAHGFVVVAHDALGPDLHQALFARALPELFALPIEAKKRNVNTKGEFTGYIGPIDGMNWESLVVEESADAARVRGFTDLMWPDGNPEFCETMVSFAKNIMKLEEMVETLVLEGLCVRGESIRAHLDMLGHGIRMSHYGAPSNTETAVTLSPHYDDIMVNAIVQHEVEGLEVHVGDGRWVAVPAEPGTIAFVAGDQLRVATNGRVPACYHRVRTPSNRDRFSVLFGRRQKDGVPVRPLDDLVDAEHPLLYNPLRHEEYSKWRFSVEGRKLEDPLKEFCGVEKVGVC
ncbi:2-oxoglutarate-dependent dioxygenase AOP3-like [Panicum virgatum]|uniref:2-oxoglutarate-dependent dioxygenase DAO n=1 Tax=Panicum virgatum TaxID=38727 RepID=A0A8T0QZP5_PANVG|nr:2-oxoglutarate-dependent dioxygenase AOP3-like [Panicum virgatum]KAG2578704.1 hypothetical protein PVAP13_6NG115400 [Panicum virgatum]